MKQTATVARQPVARQPVALPLVDDLGDAITYVMSTHALERTEERGIGILEVYSAIADPTATIADPTDHRNRSYFRGDIRVIANEETHTIATVIDLFEEARTEPRKPLVPDVKKGPPTMARTLRSKTLSTLDPLDEAWALVKHSEPEQRLLTVTPELAQKLLERNPHNRPLRQVDAQRFAQLMRDGLFLTTTDSIALDVKATLQNGQHRLTGVVLSELPQRMWLAVGQPVENFDVIDTGRVRTYGDVLSLQGEADYTALGSILRLVFLYDGFEYSEWRSHKVTNHEILTKLQEDPDRFRQAVSVARKLCSNNPLYGVPGLTKSAAGAAWYIFTRLAVAPVVDDFFDPLASTVGWGNGDSRILLRNQLANNRVPAPNQLALLVKCWNHYLEGNYNVRFLSWRKGEAMPAASKSERKR